MRTEKIVINALPLTRNKLDNMHWAKRGEIKRLWETEVFYAINKTKVKPFKGRVDIQVLYTFADKRRHDCHDNYSHKGTTDALVKRGIITDDNYTVIRRFISEGQFGEKPLTEIIITEVLD